MYFYDTCSLMHLQEEVLDTAPFYISSITLQELEHIKTSRNKDEEVKYQARQVVHLLNNNKDKYTIIHYHNEWEPEREAFGILDDNHDSRIIVTAYQLSKCEDIVFSTHDLCCQSLAAAIGLKVEYEEEYEEVYNGFKVLKCMNDDEIADFYQSNPYEDLLVNQYLILQNSQEEVIDIYKRVADSLERVRYTTFDSVQFGKVKPKDCYQQCAMDSLRSNTITYLGGPAGSGKSYLSVGYLFELLERGKIDKLIIFCNTVATKGSAKLGYYPGSREEKLLDSQIGNFLISKLGGRYVVEKLIQEEKLLLLPMSDIRGFDTSGMHAGIYITEAQNLDKNLIKLALQRIGEDSICILDGDNNAQVDSEIYAGRNNGLRRVSQVFRGDAEYGEVKMQKIYRSHIAELAELI